jgi:hypothetical protein
MKRLAGVGQTRQGHRYEEILVKKYFLVVEI